MAIRTRMTETLKLPVGLDRYQDTQPAILSRFAELRGQGKATITRNEVDHGDGYRTITTVVVWLDDAARVEFVDYVTNNFTALKAEYYARANDNNITGDTVYDTVEIAD